MSSSEFLDTVGAFCPHGRFQIVGAPIGPLVERTFGVKDLIDIDGHVTGAGNPQWLETHPAATRTAPCVRALLDVGATMVGKTITDELAYSLNGDNRHYGTPVNVNAPGRVPGGSSSGSAAAVAAGLCDFALGTDTGGSVRVPASFCGILGIRTTHGRIPLDGVVPLSPSFDTIGWFAVDPELFAEVGEVLLRKPESPVPLRRLILAEDALAETSSAIAELVRKGVPRIEASLDRGAVLSSIAVAGEGLEKWRQIFQTMAAVEAWSTHGTWIEANAPALAPAIAERFAWAKEVTAVAAAQAERGRAVVHAHLRGLLGEDGVLLLPSAPAPAPLRDAKDGDVDAFRRAAQRLTCIAGLGELPQVSLPLLHVDGLPVGISLVGPPDSDKKLLALARALMQAAAHATAS